MVGSEEVLRAGRGHRRRGGDLERQRGGGDDLREAVDLPGPGAADRARASVRADGRVVPPPMVPTSSPGNRIEHVESAFDAPVPCRAPSSCVPTMPRSCPVAREDRRDRGRRRESDRLHPGRDGAVRADPGERRQVVQPSSEAPAASASSVSIASAITVLPCPLLEVLERRLLVAAHVRLEDRALRLHRRALQHVSPCSARSCCGSSCSARPRRRSSTRQRTWHIGPTTCVSTSRSLACLDSAGSARPRATSRIGSTLALDPAGERDRLRRVGADRSTHARVIRSCEDVRAEAAGLAAAFDPAVHRGRQPAFGVRERHVDGLLCTRRLRAPSPCVVELVLAELDIDAATTETGITATPVNASAAFANGSRSMDVTSAVQPERLLACADRLGVVLARPAHGEQLRPCLVERRQLEVRDVEPERRREPDALLEVLAEHPDVACRA